MIQYFVIGAVCAVALGGLGVAVWSIHSTHKRIVARHDDLFERMDSAMQRGTAIAWPARTPPGIR